MAIPRWTDRSLPTQGYGLPAAEAQRLRTGLRFARAPEPPPLESRLGRQATA